MRSAPPAIRGFCALATGALVFAGCGGGDSVSSQILFDATTTSTSSTIPTGAALDDTGSPDDQPTTPDDGVAAEGAWRAAVGNLEGLPSECGNLHYVWSDPDRDMVIAGVTQHGLWANEDRSDVWTQLGQGAGSAQVANRLSSITRDPDNPETFWESGIYGAGVFRTDDNGQTFERLGDVMHSDLVSIDLSDPLRATLLTGVHEGTGLFRSADGGQTWDDLSSSLPDGVGFTIAPHVIDADTYLLGTNNGTESGVYRTDDGGLSWTRVSEFSINGRPLVSDDGVITWLVNGGGGTIRSVDGGLTWTFADGRGGISSLTSTLVELPGGELVTLGNRNLITSSDDGLSWDTLGPALPYVPHGVTYAPMRDAYYIWRFDCDFSTDNPIAPDAIMRWDVGGTS